MRHILWSVFLACMALGAAAQSFELGALQEVYRGHIGEVVEVPLKLTNHSEKPLILIIRRINASLGGTQKSFFCPENSCLEQEVEDLIIRLEPQESLSDFHIALDAGLANGNSSAKYLVFNRYNPTETLEFELNFSVEDRTSKEDIFTHPQIVIHDVYPNPIVDHAFINYNMTSDAVDAKIVIHNILGNSIDEYNLPSAENKVKIRAESMNAGIYFYTLYLDNEGVITRKIIVKK